MQSRIMGTMANSRIPSSFDGGEDFFDVSLVSNFKTTEQLNHRDQDMIEHHERTKIGDGYSNTMPQVLINYPHATSLFSLKTPLSIVMLATFLISVQAKELSKLLIDKPSMFIPCETNLCFVFRTERPIIKLDPTMQTTKQQKLFQCRERARIFPKLSGPFFELLDEIPELHNAFCLWGGPDQTFDGLVRFVRNVSSRKRPLKIVAGGMLFQMAHRVSNGSIQSASMTNSKLVVVSINRPAQKAFTDAIISIVGPFGSGSWWLLSGFIVLFGATYFLINYSFLTNNSLPGKYNAILEPFVPTHWLRQHDVEDMQLDQNSKESRTYLIRVWKQSAFLFLVISALFWEIGVVNFITNDKPYVLPFELQGIPIETLKRFVLNDGSAFETLLARCALSHELEHDSRPWTVVENFNEVFDALSETKNGEPRYTLASEHTALYELNNRGLCKKLAVHDSSDPLPDYSTVWYYSSHIELTTRSTLDIRISQLREERRIEKLVENSIGKVTLTCGLSVHSISIFVLLVPLCVVLFPSFMFILTVLLVRWILQRREQAINLSLAETKPIEDHEIRRSLRRAIFKVCPRCLSQGNALIGSIAF